MEVASREQRGRGFRLRQRANIRGVDQFQMITARCTKRYAESRGPGSRQLLGMQSRSQPLLLRCGQDPLRLGSRKGPAIAKNIAELRQPTPGDFGQHVVEQKLDVTISSVRVPAKLR